MTQQSLVGQALLIDEDSPSHSDTPHLVESIWRGDQPVTETSTWQHTTLSTDIHPFPGGIRTYSPRREQPQTQAIDRAANGNGLLCITKLYFLTPLVPLIGHLETDAWTQTKGSNVNFGYRQLHMTSDLLRTLGQIIRKARTLKDKHIYGKLFFKTLLIYNSIFLKKTEFVQCTAWGSKHGYSWANYRCLLLLFIQKQYSVVTDT